MKKLDCIKLGLSIVVASSFVITVLTDLAMAQSPQPTPSSKTTLPSYPLKFGAFEARFDPGGTFTLQGQGWPALNGTWTSTGSNEVTLSMSGGPGGCDGPGRYQFRMNGKHLNLSFVADDCKVRQAILDQSGLGAKRRGQSNSNSIHNPDGRRARAIGCYFKFRKRKLAVVPRTSGFGHL
jgi:hypothetical protein